MGEQTAIAITYVRTTRPAITAHQTFDRTGGPATGKRPLVALLLAVTAVICYPMNLFGGADARWGGMTPPATDSLSDGTSSYFPRLPDQTILQTRTSHREEIVL